MASLVGQQLKDTYDSLLKTSDNDALGGTYKEITDGSGNGSGLYLGTGGNVGIGSSPDTLLHLSKSNSGANNNNTLRFTDTDTTTQANQSIGRIEFETLDSNNAGVNVLIDAISEGTGGTGALILGTGAGSSTERMRIDSSGNVGIGNDSPDTKLEVGTEGDSAINMSGSADGIIKLTGAGYSFAIANNDTGTFLYNNGSSRALVFGNNETERMRIDSGGNVLVGTTSTTIASSSSGSGIGLLDDGGLEVARSSFSVAYFNRTNATDGTIIDFRKQGVSVGSISTNANSLPSDVNFKKDIDDLTLGLDFVSTLNPKSYRYKVSSDDSPKMFGLIAQEIEQSLSDFGVQENEVAMLQKIDKETEQSSEYALDYVKLVPILVNAIKELKAEIEQLKAQ